MFHGESLLESCFMAKPLCSCCIHGSRSSLWGPSGPRARRYTGFASSCMVRSLLSCWPCLAFSVWLCLPLLGLCCASLSLALLGFAWPCYSKMAPKLLQHRPQNGSKMEPKWSQNGSWRLPGGIQDLLRRPLASWRALGELWEASGAEKKCS